MYHLICVSLCFIIMLWFRVPFRSLTCAGPRAPVAFPNGGSPISLKTCFSLSANRNIYTQLGKQNVATQELVN